MSIDLSKNEFQHPQPMEINCLNLLEDADVRRYPRHDALRARLAIHHGVGQELLIVHPGGAVALALLFMAHSWSRGGRSEAILPSVGWQYYGELACRTRMHVSHYPMLRERWTFRFGVEELGKRLAAARDSIIVLNSPNNPTGASISLDELESVVGQADPSNTIVLDECYVGFGGRSASVADLVTRTPHVVVLRTFSKFYGLAGARIAYTVAGTTAADRLALVAPYLGSSCLSERLALVALDHEEKYVELARTTINEREKAMNFFETLPDCRCYRSDANFLLVYLPGRAARYADFLRENGVLVRTFAGDEVLADHIRVTIGTPGQMTRIYDLTSNFS